MEKEKSQNTKIFIMKNISRLLFLACAIVFFGCTKDKSVSEQDDTNVCFYFEAVDAGAVVSMTRMNEDDAKKAPHVSLEYSLDKSNWSPFVVNETNVSLNNVGDRVYIRAKDKNDYFCFDSASEYAWNSFSSSGHVKVGGNIMYLLDGTGKATESNTLPKKHVFFGLFQDMDKLTDASKLILPATTLTEDCYGFMFAGCSSLTAAPKLPAKKLAKSCYVCMFGECTSLTTAPELAAETLAEFCCDGMFMDCTSLTVAPKLPATTLAEFCYVSMFWGCTSLTVAPELPATKLAANCYNIMFMDCTSLTAAPKLPATELESGCYYMMFSGCTSLQSIEVNFTDWISVGTSKWLEEVSETGTFTCPAGLDVTQRDDSHIPEGWTIVTK